MGQNCSSFSSVSTEQIELSRDDSPDPDMYDLMRKSLLATTPQNLNCLSLGQHHLLFKNQSKHTTQNTPKSFSSPQFDQIYPNYPTRLLIRRRSTRNDEDRVHIYAIRYPEDTKDLFVSEQAIPMARATKQEQNPDIKVPDPITRPHEGDLFTKLSMIERPRQEVLDWVTVSREHNIYIADIGLDAEDCDQVVTTVEQVCRGQYAAYTYAKQTFGCREYPILVRASFAPVHTTVHAIVQKFPGSEHLQLDDREPHVVKYDVTKKERQKLDMHTDKSEWTFLIALSNGSGVDYEGGGTYFECLDATVHLQRGHALIFPGKLRHCGKKISCGLRFLLVGFLVDKTGENQQKQKTKQ